MTCQAHINNFFITLCSAPRIGNRISANEDHRAEVFAYMAGIAKKLEGFALEIGGWVEHAHLLVRIPAKTAVSDFIGRIKANTSKHVNEPVA